MRTPAGTPTTPTRPTVSLNAIFNDHSLPFSWLSRFHDNYSDSDSLRSFPSIRGARDTIDIIVNGGANIAGITVRKRTDGRMDGRFIGSWRSYL